MALCTLCKYSIVDGQPFSHFSKVTAVVMRSHVELVYMCIRNFALGTQLLNIVNPLNFDLFVYIFIHTVFSRNMSKHIELLQKIKFLCDMFCTDFTKLNVLGIIRLCAEGSVEKNSESAKRHEMLDEAIRLGADVNHINFCSDPYHLRDGVFMSAADVMRSDIRLMKEGITARRDMISSLIDHSVKDGNVAIEEEIESVQRQESFSEIYRLGMMSILSRC